MSQPKETADVGHAEKPPKPPKLNERMRELKLTIAVCAVVLVTTGLLVWFGRFGETAGTVWVDICWVVMTGSIGLTAQRGYVKGCQLAATKPKPKPGINV